MQHITDAEWPIMQVLWERDTSATAAEIVAAVTAQRPVSMRTVKTLIRRLVARGAVAYTVDAQDARVYHYRAAVSRENCTGARARTLLDTLSGDEVGGLLAQFLDGAQLSRRDIERLEALLRSKKEDLP